MEIIEFDISNVPNNYPGLALCLGFFDGIHLGHQNLIKDALNSGLKVGVLSFSTPPSYVLGRKDTLRSLTSVDDKADILENMGVSYLFIMEFNKITQNISRDDFINNVLKTLNPSLLICGEDFRFGKSRLGEPNYLKNYFNTHIIPIETINGEKYSSKEIRHLIYDGKVKEASNLLGHYYKIAGLVIKGKHLGTKLGFPTANLDIDFPYVIPTNGVYIGYAYINEHKYKCLISVGTHPTFNELDVPLIEVYVLDFDKNIYGQFIYIEFVDRIRDILKFKDPSDLIKQINLDKAFALRNL